jgi:hypothetical protein
VGLDYPNVLTLGETPLLDVDRDGRLDVIVNHHQRLPTVDGRHAGHWPVLRWDGSRFVPFDLLEDRPTMDRHGCAAADFGQQGGDQRPDGLADLYCITGANQGRCNKPDADTPEGAACRYWSNELFLRNPDGTFPTSSDAAFTHARGWGVESPYDRGRDVAVLDFDRDGLPDLAVANEGPSCVIETRNRLFRNTGGGFAEVDPTPVRGRQAATCVEAGDLDGNGWEDLVFCGRTTVIEYKQRCGDGVGDGAETRGVHGIRTFLNAGGTFRDASDAAAYGTPEAFSIKLRDLNRDGRVDLLFTTNGTLQVWLNDGRGFPSRTWEYPVPTVADPYDDATPDDKFDGGGADIEVGDVNLDGWPDLYLMHVDNEHHRDEMLLNDGGGTSFRKMAGDIPMPARTGSFEGEPLHRGRGDSVTAIPNWRGTGRTAFLVFNGYRANPGPVQLIEFHEAP